MKVKDLSEADKQHYYYYGWDDDDEVPFYDHDIEDGPQ